MADPEVVLARLVASALRSALGAQYADADPLIRPSQFADFQANVAMSLARQLGRPPREVAADVAAQLADSDVIEPPEVSGPGFINLTLDVTPAVPLQKVVFDYSAPNLAKEMHVGHLRTTVVGDALVRVLEHIGDEVVRANHIGDWGTQFGKMVEHLLDIGEPAAREMLADGDINAFY